MIEELPSCPLCLSGKSTYFHQDRARRYLRCISCHLVFVPEKYHLSDQEEKKRYDFHENNEGDEGYLSFLNRLATPLLKRVKHPTTALDYGCGPGPVLARILSAGGHTVTLYDKFYYPASGFLKFTYHFITCTEVVEHLRHPQFDLDRMWSLIEPGGLLGIMTKRVTNLGAFKKWHYIRDETHIAYFSEKTFDWLAKKWGAKTEYFGNDVVLFYK